MFGTAAAAAAVGFVVVAAAAAAAFVATADVQWPLVLVVPARMSETKSRNEQPLAMKT